MPMPIHLAHRMSERLAALRHDGTLPYLLPDAKTQVTVGYDERNDAQSVKTVVLSTHHTAEVSLEELRPEIEEKVIGPLLPMSLDQSELRVLVNPTGRFEVGGPIADAGLTGRKIIVDTYGGMARHGGGAFSGKDCTKVDRSAAYAARWVAKNIVAAGLARKAELQLAYAIGVARPVSMYLDTFGTETVDKQLIYKAVNEVFDLRPGAIIRDLDLRRPIYRKTAVYGHFGRDEPEFAWERTDRADDLRQVVEG
jgi:S-adenosylmethionine synthetase